MGAKRGVDGGARLSSSACLSLPFSCWRFQCYRNREDRNQVLHRFGYAIVDGHIERVGKFVFVTFLVRFYWHAP